MTTTDEAGHGWADVAQVPRLLEGEVAVVTGAAMGNGAAIAQGLGKAGAKLVLGDLNMEALSKTVAALRAEGCEVEGFELNVGDWDSCAAFAAQAEGAFGPVSILVNNAGIVRRVGIDEEGFLASVEAQLAVNAGGSAQMAKALLSQLSQTKGRIINVGSIASYNATTGGIGYGMSKGAVRMMTKAMAAEMSPMGIRVNAIAPGLMITPMTAPTRENPKTMQAYMEHIPLKRFGDAGELTGPVIFLASEQSSYVTGVMLPVDGGYLAI